MLKQFNQKFFSELVKNNDSLVLTREQQEAVFKAAKRVRSCDYIANFDVKNGVAKSAGIVTRANWIFLLTNVACYWDSLTNTLLKTSDYPKVSVNFENFVPKTPFNTAIEDVGAVPSSLVFGREGVPNTTGLEHFEEYKNLYYILDQRFVITLDVKAPNTLNARGSVILSGLEIDLNEV